VAVGKCVEGVVEVVAGCHGVVSAAEMVGAEAAGYIVVVGAGGEDVVAVVAVGKIAGKAVEVKAEEVVPKHSGCI
jgi:hypothetical protein